MKLFGHGSGSNGAEVSPPELNGATELPNGSDDLTSVELTKDERINAFLTRHGRFRALVDAVGVAYMVPDRRHEREALEFGRLLEEVYGRSVIHEITPADYSMARGHLEEVDSDGAQHNETVRWLIDEGIKRKASDIYIRVGKDTARLHMKTYGVRNHFQDMTSNDAMALVRTMYHNADGSAKFVAPEPCDCAFSMSGVRVRVNSMPDIRGISAVLRLRDPGATLRMDEIGYDPLQMEHLEEMRHAAGGLGVVCGETGSGKSTTLTAIMKDLDDTQMTIEVADPIEIEIDHITHVEIAHYVEDEAQRMRGTLGALVRQNPDWLFIGEIRDELTAAAAQNMAMQGKTVWTTLHTQSCSTAIPRMQHLGVDHDLLALPRFLNGIVNQNLLSVVCKHCGLDRHPDPTIGKSHHERFGGGIRFRNPDGCEHCIGGIAGQTVVAEVFPLCLEKDGRAHGFIRRNDMVALEKHMREVHGVRSKESHATSKIREGVVDPVLAEKVIGRIGTMS